MPSNEGFNLLLYFMYSGLDPFSSCTYYSLISTLPGVQAVHYSASASGDLNCIRVIYKHPPSPIITHYYLYTYLHSYLTLSSTYPL